MKKREALISRNLPFFFKLFIDKFFTIICLLIKNNDMEPLRMKKSVGLLSRINLNFTHNKSWIRWIAVILHGKKISIYLRCIICKASSISPIKNHWVFLYISADYYIYTNYIFLESTFNTDSHSKISVVGKDFEKYIYT